VRNLQQLVIAMHVYAEAYDNKFPPAFSLNSDNKPLHSWRVLILPYLGFEDLYKSIHLNESWDSDYNKQFHDKMPKVFYCLYNESTNIKQYTNYCMIVGENAFGDTRGNGRNRDKILASTPKLIILSERKTPICWMEPVDILQENALVGVNEIVVGIGSEHHRGNHNGANIVLADSSTHFILSREIEQKKYLVLLSDNDID
jgi:hypothetical protein